MVQTIRRTNLLGGAMVSISDFDSDDVGSNPTLTSKHVGFSLTEKRLLVTQEIRVRIPRSTEGNKE